MLPFTAKFAVVVARQGLLGFNNQTPRDTDWDAVFGAGSPRSELVKRLTAAHLNGWEAMAAFVPGVLLCVAAGAPVQDAEPHVTRFLFLRLAYDVAYATGASSPISWVRTAVWVASLGELAALYSLAGSR